MVGPVFKTPVSILVRNVPVHQDYLVAVQDGDGPWQALAHNAPGVVQDVAITNDDYGVAIACTSPGRGVLPELGLVNVVYRTKQDTTQIMLNYDCADSGTAIMMGNVTNGPQAGFGINIGGQSNRDTGFGGYQVGVDPGRYDVAMYSLRAGDTAPAVTMIRDMDIPSGTRTIALPFDISGSELRGLSQSFAVAGPLSVSSFS